MTHARWPWWLTLLVILPAAPLVATVPADADLWWHLLVGEWILEQGALPAVDTWSYTAAGRPWTNHEWLPEVISAAVYGALGNAGLVALRGSWVLAICLGLGWLVWRRLPHPLAVVLAVSLALPVIAPLTNARPHSWTWMLTVVVLMLLDGVRSGAAAAAVALPLVVAVWANLHGGFLLGWGIAGLGLGLAALGLEGPDRSPRERALLLACAVGVAVAPLANLYGLDLARYVYAELSVHHPDLPEWLPPAGGVAAAVLAFSAVPLLLALAARAVRPTEIVALLVCTAMAARHAKFVVLVAILGVVVAATALGSLSRREDARALLARSASRGAAVAVACLFLVANLGGALPSLIRGPLRVEVDGHVFPVQAVAFLAAHDLGPNLALPLGWGGYARWHLGDRYRLSLDGRNTTVYDPAFVDRFTRAFNDGDLARVLSDGPADALLVPTRGSLYPVASSDPEWRLVFRDPVAAVFVRAGAAVAAQDLDAAPRHLDFPG